MTANAELFEAHRRQLLAVAHRMLGSHSDAEDAVQEAWLRYERADTGEVTNLGAWLTRVVGRLCLDMLRARGARREAPLHDAAGGGGGGVPAAGLRLPDPVVADPAPEADPEAVALAADEVGLAMLVVLDTLGPAERLAFVLHDMFAVPFDQIAEVLDRTPNSAAQLASRARRRVRAAALPEPDRDLGRQRAAVDAFLAAAREGDFDALLAVLHPEARMFVDQGAGGHLVRGARDIAEGAVAFRQPAAFVRHALVGGVAGIVVRRDGRPYSLMAFTVVGGRIVEIHALADPARLATLDLPAPGGERRA